MRHRFTREIKFFGKWIGVVGVRRDSKGEVSDMQQVPLSAVKELEEISCDIAMIPIGGKYTMNAAKAAELINEIEPEIAVPTHYGNIVGKESDGRDFKAAVKEGIRVPLLIRHTQEETE